MNWTNIETELINDEGLELRVYLCPAKKQTIGVGHRLLAHELSISEISLTEAGGLLRNDICNVMHDLECIFGIHCLDHWTEARQHALINMGFQLGRTRFSGFVRMIAAIKADDWLQAAIECLDSKYANSDAPERAVRVAKALRGTHLMQ